MIYFRPSSPWLLCTTLNDLILLQVAYAGTYENAVKTIEKAWATVNPGLKIDYKEVESEINQFYEIFFGDIVKVLGFISVLAILISCLGLLGMATYTTETRIKEISIRKVLGSSGTALGTAFVQRIFNDAWVSHCFGSSCSVLR